MSFMSKLQSFWQKCVNSFNAAVNLFKNIFGFQSSTTPTLNDTEDDNIPIIIKDDAQYIGQDIEQDIEQDIGQDIEQDGELDPETKYIMNTLDKDLPYSSSKSHIVKSSPSAFLTKVLSDVNHIFGKDKPTDTEVLFDSDEYFADSSANSPSEDFLSPDPLDQASTSKTLSDDSSEISSVDSFVTALDEYVSDNSYSTDSDGYASDISSYATDSNEYASASSSFVPDPKIAKTSSDNVKNIPLKKNTDDKNLDL